MSGNVEGVRKALSQPGLNLSSKVNGQTAGEALFSAKCTLNEQTRWEIADLLQGAGDSGVVRIISCAHHKCVQVECLGLYSWPN